jgi:hypothetical protein
MNPVSKPQIDPELLVDGLEPPDHTGLPYEDGTFVKNFQEHPQSLLLTDAILPWLEQRFPDGQYCIGQDSGIYWRFVPSEPLRGCEAPDWFLVLGVPPAYEGQPRRSYVLWREAVAPVLALEFVSGSGLEERDRTAQRGKMWVYEQAIRVAYYGIYEVSKPGIEMYRLLDGRYRPMQPNARGRFEVESVGIEIGLWPGRFAGLELPWLRFWDLEGRLLLTGHERAEVERQEKERERQEKQELLQKMERMAERLRQAGLPED